jgi:hypothetical protein
LPSSRMAPDSSSAGTLTLPLVTTCAGREVGTWVRCSVAACLPNNTFLLQLGHGKLYSGASVSQTPVLCCAGCSAVLACCCICRVRCQHCYAGGMCQAVLGFQHSRRPPCLLCLAALRSCQVSTQLCHPGSPCCSLSALRQA